MSDLHIRSIYVEFVAEDGIEYFEVGEDVDRLAVNYGPSAVTVETFYDDGSLASVTWPWAWVSSVVLSARPAPALAKPVLGTMQVAP